MPLTSLIKPILYFTISMVSAQNINLDNKIIPESIKKEVIEAISFYPELYDTAIEFKFKDNIKKSTMQAQPRFASFFKRKENREYVILISRNIQIEGEHFTMEDIPSDVKVGWLGHELGHVMDYRERTNFGMLIFGIKYLFSSAHIKEVERTADTYAVAHGMGDYILKTKNFILDNASLSEKYKERIRRLYISPEEVMELINENKVEEEPEIVGEEGS
ncbi:hypothetical protein LS48_02730 [Aequorivita aquimaris]|jgi:hypothetical protein|uniref:Uncharacterized protein n=1 Tax=Aequorivita aquimaris TaxID=1548749 RepID=A0A137RMM3_9FLAO|nr:hypothetical protein [Aequorivita aquimaris]KXO01384.1 hypothetical protein LS48_02730 [Aequorivita aquimaris]